MMAEFDNSISNLEGKKFLIIRIGNGIVLSLEL